MNKLNKLFGFTEKNGNIKVKGLSANIREFAVFIAVYVVIRGLMMAHIITPFYETILLKICLDIILALGLNLITGITGQFSLGHAGFMALGAYSAAFMIIRTGGSIATVIPAILLGGIVAGFVGLLIGIPTLRLKGDYLAIATLGLGEIIRIVIQNIDQTILGGAAGLSGIPLYTSFEFVFIALVITYFVIMNLLRSSYGRACISVREDEIAAESMGVNVTKAKILAFVVGTFFAGIAGALYPGYVGIIQPKDFGFMKSIDILMIVVLGGLGNMKGTIFAAIALNIVSFALQGFADIRMIVYAFLLVLIMLIKSGESPIFVKLRDIFNMRKFDRKKIMSKGE